MCDTAYRKLEKQTKPACCCSCKRNAARNASEKRSCKKLLNNTLYGCYCFYLGWRIFSARTTEHLQLLMAFNGVATYTIKKMHNNNKKVNTADTIDIGVRESNHLTGQQRINRVRTPICIYEYV